MGSIKRKQRPICAKPDSEEAIAAATTSSPMGESSSSDTPIDPPTSQARPIMANQSRKSMKYKQYSDETVAKALNLIQSKGVNPTKAFRLCDIPKSTGYRLLREFNTSGGILIPRNNKVAPPSTVVLKPEHNDLLINHFDQHPSSTIGEARKLLLDTFQDLRISFSELYSHLIENCSFSLQTPKRSIDQQDPQILETRYQVVKQWKDMGVDFTKNCVFVDQAGFDVHLARVHARSNKTVHATTKLQTVTGASFSLMGCASPFGLLNMSKVQPLSTTEAQKLNEQQLLHGHNEDGWKKGISTFHLAKFIEEVLNMLDQHNMKGFYVVLNNHWDYHLNFLEDLVRQRGHSLLLLPPSSPFLNPMESCWSTVKRYIRRGPLSENDVLVERVNEVTSRVTAEDCQGWIQHSITYWDKCMNKELDLV